MKPQAVAFHSIRKMYFFSGEHVRGSMEAGTQNFQDEDRHPLIPITRTDPMTRLIFQPRGTELNISRGEGLTAASELWDQVNLTGGKSP